MTASRHTRELRATYADIRKLRVVRPPLLRKGNHAIYARNKRSTHDLRKLRVTIGVGWARQLARTPPPLRSFSSCDLCTKGTG
jgi:hypothetical protein